MRFIKVLFAAAIVLSISVSVYSQENKPAADSYSIDPVHSSIGFNVRHLAVSKVPGRFKDFTATINYDPTDVTRSSVEFTAKVAGVDTGNQSRDDHLRSADFFDVEKYPEMTFKSTRVESKGKSQFVVYGAFTLKGVTKEVAIPFELFGPIKDPRGSMRIGVEADLTINRKDYGVTWSKTMDGGGLVVSDDVRVELRLEAVKQEAKPAAK